MALINSLVQHVIDGAKRAASGSRESDQLLRNQHAQACGLNVAPRHQMLANDHLTESKATPMRNQIWVFVGEGALHPGAVFTSKALAETWIKKWAVSGILTAYPLDQSIYDWAIEHQFFAPRFPSQSQPTFVQRFSSAYVEHYHYDNGKSADS